MSKSLALLLAVSAAGLTTYGAIGITDDATGSPTVSVQSQGTPQECPAPKPWNRAVLDSMRLEQRPEFRIPVTVRTEPGQPLTAFEQEIPPSGVAMPEGGRQFWIFGETAAGETHTDTISDAHPAFWSTEPFNRAYYENVDSALSDAASDLISPQAMVDRLTTVLPDTVTFEGQPVSAAHLLRVLTLGATTGIEAVEAVGPVVETAADVCFEVDGWMVCLKPWTAHEGFLQRVHIDVPRNRKFNEITVVGIYSKAADVSALALPALPCVWCGRIQVCSAGTECP
jgi:hypothetical protein